MSPGQGIPEPLMPPVGSDAAAAWHIGGEPVRLVATWLAAVFDRHDLAEAWPLTDEPLRLALTQSWILMEHDRPAIARENRDDLAESLTRAQQPAHQLWLDFAGWRVIRWRQVLPPWVVDASRRGFVSEPRLLTADVEAVMIADAPDGPRPYEAGEPLEVERFLVRHGPAGPRLAGIGGVLPMPGWPPTETDPLPT